jgi:uncharacterized UPF0160 family protein
MQTIVTHSGSFDPDDVLAVAALQLLLGKEHVEVVRSRDEAIMAKADFVVDVGRVYDPATRRFDHHQEGAPVRDNGVPYSALGLVWRHYGEEIAGSAAVADDIEERLIQPIDAADNHQTVCHPGLAGVTAFEFFDIVDLLKPLSGSEESYDGQFQVAVDLAVVILTRLIAHSTERQKLLSRVREQYEATTRRAVMVFEDTVPRHLLVDLPEVQVVVCPVTAAETNHWMAAVVPVKRHGFQNRVVFPEAWAGLTDEALSEVSGITDAVFCHKERYIFIAKTKEGAIKAAHHTRP